MEVVRILESSESGIGPCMRALEVVVPSVFPHPYYASRTSLRGIQDGGLFRVSLAN
jgi:hypothetical protein